jgi:hypothetical protein
MPWSWSLLAVVLLVGAVVVAGRVRALDRERARLVEAVGAVGALAAAHRALVDDLRRGRRN